MRVYVMSSPSNLHEAALEEASEPEGYAQCRERRVQALGEVIPSSRKRTPYGFIRVAIRVTKPGNLMRFYEASGKAWR